jgi:hypothetical protein
MKINMHCHSKFSQDNYLKPVDGIEKSIERRSFFVTESLDDNGRD